MRFFDISDDLQFGAALLCDRSGDSAGQFGRAFRHRFTVNLPLGIEGLDCRVENFRNGQARHLRYDAKNRC